MLASHCNSVILKVLIGRSEPDYHCLLCSTAVTVSFREEKGYFSSNQHQQSLDSALSAQVREVVVHLSTASHQLAFLAQAKPELYLHFAAHSSTSSETWDKATLNSLDSMVIIVIFVEVSD